MKPERSGTEPRHVERSLQRRSKLLRGRPREVLEESSDNMKSNRIRGLGAVQIAAIHRTTVPSLIHQELATPLVPQRSLDQTVQP